MPDPVEAAASANDATVAAVATDADPQRRLSRLRADVVQTQRVLDELVEGAARAEAKAVEVDKVYKAKARETDKMITAARRAVKDAESALKAEES